jgi:hypothetical protein
MDVCYEPILAQRPCATGTVWLYFEFAADGTLDIAPNESEAGLLGGDLGSCIAAWARRWPLPKPPGGGARIRYPLRFKPISPPGPTASCDAAILARTSYGGSQLPEAFKPDGWQALCASKEGAFVQPVDVTLRPFHDEMADHKPEQQTGREVVVRGCAKPIVILRDVHGVAAGKVASARVISAGKGDKRTARIRLGREVFDLRRERTSDNVLKLVLEHAWSSETLLTWRDDGGPTEWKVRWAGDLDGDGRLDLLLEDDGESTVLQLFVSGTRATDHSMGLVAETYWGGC